VSAGVDLWHGSIYYENALQFTGASQLCFCLAFLSTSERELLRDLALSRDPPPYPAAQMIPYRVGGLTVPFYFPSLVALGRRVQPAYTLHPEDPKNLFAFEAFLFGCDALVLEPACPLTLDGKHVELEIVGGAPGPSPRSAMFVTKKEVLRPSQQVALEGSPAGATPFAAALMFEQDDRDRELRRWLAERLDTVEGSFVFGTSYKYY
jgi:hypothetical protein